MKWWVEIRSKNVAGFPSAENIMEWIRNNVTVHDYGYSDIGLSTIIIYFLKEEDYNLFRLTEGLNWHITSHIDE